MGGLSDAGTSIRDLPCDRGLLVLAALGRPAEHGLRSRAVHHGWGSCEPANPPAPSQWWIGVQCRVADPALREQLGLEENVGLLVEEVVPNSPAAQAELRRYDVLAKAGEKDLRSVEDLVGAINAANVSSRSLSRLIRRGEKAPGDRAAGRSGRL